uniref:ATP-dependent RNA helicase n=1 Tax=Strongyloides venezuelensis TaxID=75913 RepID=A0A0K0F9H3_STRVS
MKVIQFSQSVKNPNIKVFHNVCDEGFTDEVHYIFKNQNINRLSKLQECLIPAIMERKYDVFIEANKGTGKKFGYILPIVNCISEMKSTLENKENPFAIILINDIESCKKVISEILRLYPVAKIIRLIGSDKEANFIREINEGCDVIVGSIIKFYKIIQPINYSLLKRDILKANYFVFDECENLIHGYWENYLKFICYETLKKQLSNQIRIFSTCALKDYTAEMFMKNYAQNNYVIMKFQINLSPGAGKSLATFPVVNEYAEVKNYQKENCDDSNIQNPVNCPKVIFTQPQHNIVVNNYTNNQQITSNQSYNDYPPLPMGHPFYICHNNSSHQNRKKDTFCNVRYNPFRAQLVNPNLSVFPRSSNPQNPPFNLQSHQHEIFSNGKYEDENNRFNDFTETGMLRRFDVIEVQLFDLYTNLLTVLKHLFNESINYKIIVFVKRAEGCMYGSHLCNNSGIKSRIISKNHNIYEVKDNLDYFKSRQNIVLFVEDNFEHSIMNKIHSHVIITLNISENEESFENKVKYLGDVHRNGGIFIIMGTSAIVSEEWIIKRFNVFNVTD